MPTRKETAHRETLRISGEALAEAEQSFRDAVEHLLGCATHRNAALVQYRVARDAAADLPEGDEVTLTGGDTWDAEALETTIANATPRSIYFSYEDDDDEAPDVASDLAAVDFSGAE